MHANDSGRPVAPVTRDYAYYALAVLLAANFLNYTDRFLISAVGPLVQEHFKLSEARFGGLSSVFTIGYLVASPFVGLLSDRYNRPKILAVCVFVWSLATAGTALSRNYTHLVWARIFTGVGEAGCLSVGPALVADYFPKAMRGKMLSIFYAGMPLGSAAGYILGGQLGGRQYKFGLPFLIAAIPGFVIMMLVQTLREPRLGAVEGVDLQKEAAEPASWKTYLDLARNRTFILIVLALATVTFLIMPLVFFFPHYFVAVKHVELDRATLLIGIVAFMAGVGGNLLSGYLGDRLAARTPRAYTQLACLTLAAGIPFLFVTLLSHRPLVYAFALFGGMLSFFMYLPLLNTQIANITTTHNRATAFAFTVTAMHLIGDAVSPTVFVIVADRIGGVQIHEGREIAATAAHGLQVTYLIFAGLLVVSVFFSWLASRSIPDRKTEAA